MIAESYYWKRELARTAIALQKRTKQKRWPEASQSAVEMQVMIGFYSVRKLMEAKKLSDSLTQKSISVTCYNSLGKPVTWMNNHRLDELYDFKTSTNGSISLIDLSNQIIHSYIFSTVHKKTGELHSLLFCSDRKRNRVLYEIKARTIIKLFDSIGKNYPSSIHFHFNENRGDWDVRVGR